MRGQPDHAPTPRKPGISAACLAIVAGIALSLVATASAAREEEVWRVLLRKQLAEDLQCQLNYTTNLRKFEIAGKQAVDVRAHCHDGRSYDASWLPDQQQYEFRLCEPTAC